MKDSQGRTLKFCRNCRRHKLPEGGEQRANYWQCGACVGVSAKIAKEASNEPNKARIVN